MKITKKMRKKLNGINAATKIDFEKGHSVPMFANVAPPNMAPIFKKVKKGVPYVNEENFR